MTLHWWMHWFWVTALLTLHGSELIHAAPQSKELENITHTGIKPQSSDRESRAMHIPKQSLMTTQPENNKTINTTDKEIVNKQTNNTNTNKTMEIVHPSIQWTPATATDANATSLEETNATAAPPTVEYANVTDTQNATFPKRRNLTRPEFIKEGTDGVSESKIVTEKPLSLETPLLQTRIPPVESYRRGEQESGMDTGAIAGISFAALVLGALAGSTAFVLYRRRYLNKPQTLNDKCSNPDSSGYLDDSTVRDNSEEMYSLDNDSFLNSLEAMTIQNYWTDTVKHTKL